MSAQAEPGLGPSGPIGLGGVFPACRKGGICPGRIMSPPVPSSGCDAEPLFAMQLVPEARALQFEFRVTGSPSLRVAAARPAVHSPGCRR